MPEFAVQVNFKTPTDALINVRADNEDELYERLNWIEDASERIQQAEKAVRGSAPASTLSAVRTVQAQMPASVIRTNDPAVIETLQTFCTRQGSACTQAPVCPCGSPCDANPTSFKNGQYFKHLCPQAPSSHDHGVWCNDKKRGR